MFFELSPASIEFRLCLLPHAVGLIFPYCVYSCDAGYRMYVILSVVGRYGIVSESASINSTERFSHSTQPCIKNIRSGV